MFYSITHSEAWISMSKWCRMWTFPVTRNQSHGSVPPEVSQKISRRFSKKKIPPKSSNLQWRQDRKFDVWSYKELWLLLKHCPHFGGILNTFLKHLHSDFTRQFGIQTFKPYSLHYYTSMVLRLMIHVLERSKWVNDSTF